MNEQSDFAIIDVVCPKCNKKARFKAAWKKSYKRNPQDEGLLTCTHCGTVKKHSLSALKYYYAIEIEDRHLVARNKENLIHIYNYFKNREKLNDDPDLDYPKVLYLNRDKILLKIEKLLEIENK